MSPTFRTRAIRRAVAETPERLFDDLPPRPGRPDALWAHQADVLRTYHREHLQTADIALELPTGAGKTLPGLLIAEWRRQSFGRPVVYACPTRNLARQTAHAAERIGFDVVTLVGWNRNWSTPDKVRYESGAAVAITTYSTLFNARPALEPPGSVVFDDAHAAESFVAGAWSVAIGRAERPELFQQVLELVGPALPHVLRDALDDPQRPSRPTVHLVNGNQIRRVAGRLSSALRALGKRDNLYWAGEALGIHLDRCQMYLSWDAILLRPILAPTASHPHFSAADQRVYLSATLGAGGELERAFGRSPIARLPIPQGWEGRGAGRRFFVFPTLHLETPPREFASAIIEQAGKALVLAPSEHQAREAGDLVRPPTPLHGPPTRDDDVDAMPSGTHLQERFLSETLLAGRVLRERQRTRVVQGAGRCTRGLSDYSVVVVLGDDLTRFLALPDVHDALRPDLQAEVDFGRLNSEEASTAELGEYIASFLAQDMAWREQAEPALLEARHAASVADPPENAELADAARHEVAATTALWSGDWASASRRALDAAAALRSPQLAGYRAFWTYLAAMWLEQLAEDTDDDALRSSSLDLLRRAYAAARNTSWLREAHPLPSREPVLDELDEAAVTAAAQNGPRSTSGAAWATQHTELIAALEQTEARRFERGLTILGALLGAESSKPTGDGRTDSAWIWPQRWWLALEAKSEQKQDTLISQTTVRQVNDQLKTIALDRGEPTPENSAVLIVSPRPLADITAAATAEPFVHITTPEIVTQLARDAVAAWKLIRAQAQALNQTDYRNLVRRVFAEHRLLPSDLTARLLRDTLHG
ncbi:hypothetical protein Ae168Ps1_6197c [Pseudonocardia sp. Ae168_Ps1]|uniref:DEAD/DEAH box helicase n=1 Tax=unclassified Pseudonocardia TaxID=2619320 RepID=UPI00094AC1D9|nr:MULTISPECIES: DEAD/DEAH box helicase [unclassified Pseudonocardia]OLL70450.1 hypothetical protein Ae168Ps1_6197c [Pseudonocardia sp. Ae168_Ps1]OLL71569.1 hypothetical protein Ae263Ps1_6057c [Pseudonocardia sp. Ae263_Ps1]